MRRRKGEPRRQGTKKPFAHDDENFYEVPHAVVNEPLNHATALGRGSDHVGLIGNGDAVLPPPPPELFETLMTHLEKHESLHVPSRSSVLLSPPPPPPAVSDDDVNASFSGLPSPPPDVAGGGAAPWRRSWLVGEADATHDIYAQLEQAEV